MNKDIAQRRRSFAIAVAVASLNLWHFLKSVNNSTIIPSSSHENVAVVAPTAAVVSGPLSCQDVSGISIDVPGVTISNDTLTSKYTSTNSNWGNTISPYWAARVYAELGGYRFSGIPLGKENEWMRNLPTSVESKPARREALKSFCSCSHPYHETKKQYRFFHGCNYGWGEIYQTIRDDTRSALGTYMKSKPRNETDQVFGLLGKDDWLIYERCNVLQHEVHGFGTLETYDVIPSEGNFTVYTVESPKQKEHKGLCNYLHELRNEHILSRNSNAKIVPLSPSNEQWIDFARLVYAPNLLIPSAGSSWVLWSIIANTGNVHTVPHLGGDLVGTMDTSIYPPNFSIVKSSVIYPPKVSNDTRTCLGFDHFDSSNLDHCMKLLECFVSGI